MTFLANDGKTRIVTPTPAAEKTDGSRKYVTKSGGSDLTVTILDRPCVDTMTGMPHPNTVVGALRGQDPERLRRRPG